MAFDMGVFYAAGQESLRLEVEAGQEYFSRPVLEPSLNRPGLALAGFLQYFASRRVQVFGLAEFAYLKNLALHEQQERMEKVMATQIPGIILSRNRRAPQSMLVSAAAHRIPILRSPMITSRLINAATLIMEELLAPSLQLQGTMVDILGIGVLIEGPPGIGKSETTLTLIKHGHSLIADDVTRLVRRDQNRIIASATEITRYHMEIRGLGIVHVPSLFGISSVRQEKALNLIVSLYPGKATPGTGTCVEKEWDSRDVLGVRVPAVSLPVAPGRDMAHVIEVAALNQKLRLLGHDAEKELDDRVMDRLARKGRG